MLVRTIRFLDDLLIDRFYQPIANTLFTLLGVTQFRIAQVCVCVSFAFFGLGLIFSDLDFRAKMSLLSMWAILSTALSWLFVSEFRSEERQMHLGFRNPRRLNLAHRVALFLWCIGNLYWDSLSTFVRIEWECRYLGWLLFLSTFYFAACDWPTSYLKKDLKVEAQ